LSELMEEGVIVQACKACADKLGVSDNLTQMRVDVTYMGEKLTNFLKEGWAVLTY